MPEKHLSLIDTLIFIFCGTSAQKKPSHFFPCLRRSHGGTPPFQNVWIRPWKERKKERSSQAGRERGRAGRERGSEGGQAGRQGERDGRQGESEGRQAGGDGGHADPVLLNTFHLVLT